MIIGKTIRITRERNTEKDHFLKKHDFKNALHAVGNAAGNCLKQRPATDLGSGSRLKLACQGRCCDVIACTERHTGWAPCTKATCKRAHSGRAK